MYWYFWVIVVAWKRSRGQRSWHLVAGDRALAVQPRTHGCVTIVNLLSVRSYGEAEFWFAPSRSLRSLHFSCAGVLFTLGPGRERWGCVAPYGSRRFHANGIVPVLTGAVAATGFYFGAEIGTIGLPSPRNREGGRGDEQSVIWPCWCFISVQSFLVVAIVPGTIHAHGATRRQRHGGAADSGGGHRDEYLILTAVLSAVELRPVRFVAMADGARRARPPRASLQLFSHACAACRCRILASTAICGM